MPAGQTQSSEPRGLSELMLSPAAAADSCCKNLASAANTHWAASGFSGLSKISRLILAGQLSGSSGRITCSRLSELTLVGQLSCSSGPSGFRRLSGPSGPANEAVLHVTSELIPAVTSQGTAEIHGSDHLTRIFLGAV